MARFARDAIEQFIEVSNMLEVRKILLINSTRFRRTKSLICSKLNLVAARSRLGQVSCQLKQWAFWMLRTTPHI